MKKKAIEKISYLGAKKAGKKHGFVAAAEIVDISDEKHLFVEVYENEKRKLDVPIYRLVYTEKDWGNYHPESASWSACSVINEDKSFIWDEKIYHQDSKTYMDDEDIDKIKNFSKKRYITKKWESYLLDIEKEIKNERYQKRLEKRGERLRERCNNIPDIPEDFVEWYKNQLFKNKNYIYYKRKGRYATFWCSHCGGEYRYATKAKDTYEGQFEHIVDVPVRYGRARCELCDTEAVYQPAGNMKGAYDFHKKCYIGQPYKENGTVIRYFEVKKVVMIGKPEYFDCVEIARTYFEDKKKIKTDYRLYDGYLGIEDWYDHNIGGLGPQIKREPGAVYPETYEMLKGTILQYSGIKEFAENYDEIPLANYMETYINRPYIEMLSKMGMYHIVRNLIEGGCGVKVNNNAKTPADLLGINNNKMNVLRECHGELDMLKVFRLERDMNQKWDTEICENLRGMISSENKLRIALQYMTARKLLNRIEKYAGTEYGAVCSDALRNLRHVEHIYLDYLEMRQNAGYELTNSIYQYPKDLFDAHKKMVKEVNEKELDARLLEVKQKYPDIRRKYSGWRKLYFYEDENMIIRPAKSAEEIVIEGRSLHHCVGGDGYLGKHNRGESIILLLRFKEHTETPYITVEIRGTKVIQWYGAYDKKPDRKNMEKWIENYVNWLKGKGVETLLKAAV